MALVCVPSLFEVGGPSGLTPKAHPTHIQNFQDSVTESSTVRTTADLSEADAQAARTAMHGAFQQMVVAADDVGANGGPNGGPPTKKSRRAAAKPKPVSDDPAKQLKAQLAGARKTLNQKQGKVKELANKALP